MKTIHDTYAKEIFEIAKEQDIERRKIMTAVTCGGLCHPLHRDSQRKKTNTLYFLAGCAVSVIASYLLITLGGLV